MMKYVLFHVIFDTQRAFDLEQLNIDNFIAKFKLRRSIWKRNNGKKEWMSLTLDMSKAYDKVEFRWGALEKLMLRIGFAVNWVKIIVDCTSTAQFSFLINHSLKGLVFLHVRNEFLEPFRL